MVRHWPLLQKPRFPLSRQAETIYVNVPVQGVSIFSIFVFLWASAQTQGREFALTFVKDDTNKKDWRATRFRRLARMTARIHMIAPQFRDFDSERRTGP